LGRGEGEKRGRAGRAAWAGLPRTRRKEGVGFGPWLSSGRNSRGGEVFFLFLLLLLIQNLFQIHFKIYLKYFQTLVKITHLKNKMQQHDLHTIVAKPYDKFYFKEKYYSFYIFMSTKTTN